MKSVRLLPVVIFAAAALLLFKGIGLIANGGYVLTGPNAVLAAGSGGGPAGSTVAGATPPEAVLTDTSPTLDDPSPTMPTRETAAAAAHGSTSETSAEDDAHGSTESSSASSSVAEVACPPVPAAAADPSAVNPATGCAPSQIPVNEHGDALPMVQVASGDFVPIDMVEGDKSAETLEARLAERRAALDKREADITMRLALLEAAEKRLDERTAELAALEARVAGLVDEKQAAEDAGFKAIVSMYESMKPKEAAKIFDTLNTTVLVKLVRAMNPRKMSPILAAMSPEPAQKLTISLAATENTDVVTAASENLAALPQIVGQ